MKYINTQSLSKIVARYGLFYVLMILVSCAQSDDIEMPPAQKGDKVNFNTETIDDYATRSTGHTSNGINAISSMGVYASYTVTPWSSGAPVDFMNNQKVERANYDAPWLYSPEQLWPGSGYVSFFAYAPHSDNAVYESNKPILTANTGTPSLSYTIASTHNKQVDLLVATPVKDQTKRDNVTIPLRHALTKIAFSARVANEPSAGVTYQVTQIRLDNLYGSGTILMDGTNRSWNLTGSANQSYEQTTINGGLKSLFPLTTVYQSITPASGHLFLLPQQLDEAASVTVTYSTQEGTNIPEIKTFTITLAQAISQWRAGDAYNMMFTIDNGSSMIVAPTAWDKTDVPVDIKNRILNVTRIQANVYPGVAARIFFWSNQPKDSVYVREKGNLDNGNQPGATEYMVNEVFETLSGVKNTTTSYSPHIVYSGFDGVSTVSGEGYIDVLHAISDFAPYKPILADGDKRHIWLNASGLSRNILLNTVVRANSTTTPYVGTFHRWNETGERIVTWGAKYKWTAQVVDQPVAKSILLDRQPSPFMASGLLYGNNYVGDPETAQLHPDSTNMITGKGIVYFRVGWSSRLANRGTAPRYGQIEVKEYAADGTTVVNTRYLYIRQGELEDYVMRPNDLNATATDTRLLAVKWSPYNLTAANIGTGGTSVANHPQITVNGGTFTSYPTQAGAYFAWAANPLNGNHRRAYHPQNPAAGLSISSWNVSPEATSSTWNSQMNIHETCPPGYRRPFHGSVTQIMGSTSHSELKQSLFRSYSTLDNQQQDTYLNRLFGYYADGFFDRHHITSEVQVRANTANVAYIGGLFYNHITKASLFFPSSGRRGNNGALYFGANSETNMDVNTNIGLYSTSGRGNSGDIFSMSIRPNTSDVSAWSSDNGFSIRCVRDNGFTAELNPAPEVLVPTAMSFNVNSTDIGPTIVEQYTNFIVSAISSVINPPHLVRAKVTFTGTVTSTATTETAIISDLLSATYLKVGSTVTYDFSRVTWDNSVTTKQISISVDNAKWEYTTDNGNVWTEGHSGAAANLTNRGVVILKKKQ